MNFSPKILELSVGIFGIVFPSSGSCLMNCLCPGTNVFRFCCEFGIGTIFKQSEMETQTASGLCVQC